MVFRFGILREARNAAQLDGLDIVVIDLGVRQYVNFVLGLTPVQENYVNYVSQGANQAVRRTTERICACEFLERDRSLAVRGMLRWVRDQWDDILWVAAAILVLCYHSYCVTIVW